VTWVKLDDGFADSPKVIGLSDRAFRVHVRALCYASAHLTDGYVPAAKAAEWGAKPATELVAVGIWLETISGYLIHDFLDYNPSREQVQAERAKARERRQKGGRTSPERRPTLFNPDPTRPDPDPETPKAKAPKAATRPTEDQVYLATKITETWGTAKGTITIAGLQKLNDRYGVSVVSDALRSLRGFPPEEAVQSPFAYVEAICKGDAA
jgi:hypothetical protein